MSDMGFSFTQTSPVPAAPGRVNVPHASTLGPRISLVEALGRPAGFRPDARFGGVPVPTPSEREVAMMQVEAVDPISEAYGRGYTDGHALASEEAEAHAIANHAAREALMLSFAKLDAVMEEDLRLRLRDTVAALCEATLAPLAIDEAALAQRIDRAVAMLARADDERVVRLHPADIDLVSHRLTANYTVQPDSSLERGTVRVETASGGVEDGPATWRLAIAEALHQA